MNDPRRRNLKEHEDLMQIKGRTGMVSASCTGKTEQGACGLVGST
jgi:hypothetical protein